MSDPFDADEPTMADEVCFGWRRVYSQPPETVQQAEQMALAAWRQAWTMGIGIEHRAHENGECEHVTAIRTPRWVPIRALDSFASSQTAKLS